MNWVNALCNLYEKNENLAGKFQAWGKEGKKQLILLPLSHTTVLAQIEVSLNGQGDFLRARSLSKEEALTIIPVSEESSIRTSGPFPHPLMDSLQYIAGDYDAFNRMELDKKGIIVSYQGRYNDYISNLENWCSSDFAHPKARVVLAYLIKAQLLQNLVEEKVLLTDNDGYLTEDKINGIAQGKAFVRFRVETEEVPDLSDETGRFSPEIWKDTTLHKCYCDYLRSQPVEEMLCYLTGDIDRITVSYPKKIRNEGDGTKLISSNDKNGYTFRGRFRDSKEAFSIGYEASQKAHNALKWIIRRQGYLRDGLCVVAWESDLNPYVSIFYDAADIVAHAHDELHNDDFNDTSPVQQDTNHITAAQFNKALDGYLCNIGNTSNMAIIALDAVSMKGRLAITYYNRMPYAYYTENIAFWHKSCCWKHAKFVNKQLILFDGMASLNDIALALYGTEQDKFLKLKTDTNGKAPMLVSTFQRLVPCMLEHKRIPKDMVRLAVLRASTPLAYEDYNWRKILTIACSLVKKAKYDWKGEIWDMALQHDCTKRSYLYGRLLAIADLVEEATYTEEEKKRETNAMRYMSAFSRRPFRTWQLIEEKLLPYFNKLSYSYKVYFKKLLNEIQDKFIPETFADDTALDGLYLLGYHSQVSDHFNKKKDHQETEQEDERGKK